MQTRAKVKLASAWKWEIRLADANGQLLAWKPVPEELCLQLTQVYRGEEKEPPGGFAYKLGNSRSVTFDIAPWLEKSWQGAGQDKPTTELEIFFHHYRSDPLIPSVVRVV